MVRNQFHVNPGEFEEDLGKKILNQKLRRVMSFCSLPTSVEKKILTAGAGLTDENKEALEKYLFEIKAASFAAAFGDALNIKHRSSINMEI